MDRLFGEIVAGMRKCKELGKIPVSMAIDTWAVDYVLLDEQDRILGDTYGYRDHRTDGMDAEVAKNLPETELYAKTGIQKQIFNTVYQLMAVKQKEPELLQRAKTLLMLPDYFGLRLTGNKLSEYTNGSTTQLVNPTTFQWDTDLIRKLGYPEDIFLPLQMPGTKVGQLLPKMQKEVGFDLEVVLCGSHDTASAVMAVPQTSGDGIYISSGTWSLMGIESLKPIINGNAAAANFTNEGGVGYIRYLKNIMGLWIIQCVQKQLVISFAEMVELAKTSTYTRIFDVNAARFSAPQDMRAEIRAALAETGEAPATDADLINSIYHSLAYCYGEAFRELEALTGQYWDKLYIAGGGAKNATLNELTAHYTGKQVVALPIEATAIGNLRIQMQI